jgi:Protein of unknown function (DUF4030)
MKDKFQYPKEINDIRFKDKNIHYVLNSIKGIKEHPIIDRKKSGIRKIAYSSIAVVAFLAIFIGSAYVSPAMAKVVAQIPYLSSFIKQEEIKYQVLDVVADVLIKEGYDLRNIEISIPKKEMTILLAGTKQYLHDNKVAVQKSVNEALDSNQYGKYSVKVKVDTRVFKTHKETAEEAQYIKDSQDLERKIIEQLEKNGYVTAFPVEARISKMEKFIYVAVPKTEKRIPELKELLRSVTKKYGEFEEFKLRLTRIDMKAREQELRWGKNNIVSIIGHGLMENDDFKVTGYGYSFHPLPLQIKLKTSIKSSDSDAKEIVGKIENEIKTFIQTDELTKEVRNDPYEIIILSKDKKRLN